MELNSKLVSAPVSKGNRLFYNETVFRFPCAVPHLSLVMKVTSRRNFWMDCVFNTKGGGGKS
jgi:hypothetical protein